MPEEKPMSVRRLGSAVDLKFTDSRRLHHSGTGSSRLSAAVPEDLYLGKAGNARDPGKLAASGPSTCEEMIRRPAWGLFDADLSSQGKFLKIA
jgi:hypothetical protein